MEFTNISIVILPVVGFFLMLFGVSLVTNMLCKKFKQPFPFKYVNIWLIVIMVVTSFWQVLNSPITRPVNDVHNKVLEINQLKREQIDVELPTLKDNSREIEREDLSSTPLFNEAINNK